MSRLEPFFPPFPWVESRPPETSTVTSTPAAPVVPGWGRFLRALRSSAILFVLAVIAGAQDFSDLKVEKIASALRFTEGPVWSHEGFLLFSDSAADKLFKFVPGKGFAEM